MLKNEAASALKAQECSNVNMWLQAPYETGDFTLRLLFYYGIQSATTKYRLVRHTWKFKVHAALSTEMTCVISNAITNELGLNVTLKNESQTAAISEIYINSLSLYSEEHKLNVDVLYCKL